MIISASRTALECRRYDTVKVEHRHDFHQVVLPFKGTMEIEIDGSAGFVDRCQGAFVAADRKHEFISIDASEFIVLDINSSNLFGINCGHDVFQYLDSKKFFPITRQIECLSGYAAIRKTYLDQEVASTAWATLLISEIIEPIACSHSRNIIALNIATSFINANFSDRLTVELIAKKSGVSVRKLHALFSENLEITPHAYIIKKRLERAMLLLRASDKSLQEIAYLTGHADHTRPR